MRKGRKLKKLIKIFFAVTAIATLLKIYYESKWLDITIGIFSIEFANQPIGKVSCKSLMYIMNAKQDETLFFEEMRRNGWILSEVYGRGHLFEKSGEEILVISKLVMNRYRVYEIQNKNYFLSVTD